MNTLLENKRDSVKTLCRRYGVKRLSAFGSVMRDDFSNDRSDIDLLVQFDETDQPGYADRYLAFAEQLEQLFGRPLDLLTERSLKNPYLKKKVQGDTLSLYED